MKNLVEQAKKELEKIYKTTEDIDFYDIEMIQEKYNVEISTYCIVEYGEDIEFFSNFGIDIELLNYINPNFKDKIYSKIDYKELCRDYAANATVYYDKYNHIIYFIKEHK